jgi:hypothetical protein
MMYFDRSGDPIDLLTWAAMFEDMPSRVVKVTQVGDAQVITAWVGFDEYDRRPPLIFGSIIRTSGAYSHEIRSVTEADALVAHETLVGIAERLQKIRDDKAQAAATMVQMLERREQEWRERIGDDAWEEAKDYWREKFTAEILAAQQAEAAAADPIGSAHAEEEEGSEAGS